MLQKNKWIDAIALLVLLLFTWLRVSGLISRVTDPDPGLFQSFAWQMQQGKTLYAEIWDHKPPLIYYLNLAFITLFGPTENAIAYGSLFFTLLQTAVVFFILKKITHDIIASFTGTALFICTFFSVFLLGSGNYTEQYGVLFSSASLLFFIQYISTKDIRFVVGSGILSGISIWFKEPFIFSAVPLGIYLLALSIKNKSEWRGFIAYSLFFLVPALFICNALALTGSWPGYKEQLHYSRHYAALLHYVPFEVKMGHNFKYFFGAFQINHWVAFGIWCIALISLLSQRKFRIIGMLLLGQQLFDYVAEGMSGSYFFHYYIQGFPSTLIIIISGLCLIPARFPKIERPVLSYVFSAVILIYIFIAKNPFENIKFIPEKEYKDPVVEYLNTYEFQTPRHVAIASKDIGGYLLRARGDAKLRYSIPYPFHWVRIPGKKFKFQLDEMVQEFMADKPKYVIRSKNWAEMYTDSGLDTVICNEYAEVASTPLSTGGKVTLLQRRQ
jgi:4-amino-4-deoxy-L-arabinose transferase-like glycosyltransferase